MRIVLIGARGQLGSDLLPVLQGDVIPWGHEDIDITRAGDVSNRLREVAPQLVINAAAYNLVDQAEQEPETAMAVNAFGPRNLALACRDIDAALLNVSSDYVFGLDTDRSTPYGERDAPGPQSAYATSKLTGEYFVRSLCPRHFVVRTCGLYGRVATRGKGNFVETMLRLGRERDELGVVDDQRCTPSWTQDVARAIADLCQTDRYGLYHATNAGDMTWYEFVCEIFRQAQIDVSVRPIATAEFAAPAPRPAYSVLDCAKLTDTIGRSLPHWRDALSKYLQQRSQSQSP